MSDNMIRAVEGDGDDGVIKGSNFPTPMGMAPISPSDSAPQAPDTTSAPAQPQQEAPTSSSDGSDVTN